MPYRKNNREKTNRGIGSVEIVVGVSIASLVILFSIHTISNFVKTGADQVDRIRALYLAEEALEVARFWHDEDWENINTLTDDVLYYIDFSGSKPATSTTPILIDSTFTQSVTFSEVRRDAVTDDIVVSGGLVDTDTRLVTAEVAWNTSTTTLLMYLSDINNP